MANNIPVTVISGFLGAGKTTLVNHLLTQNRQHRIGVVVNEFGEVGIDGQLIAAEQEALIEINNGCVCCTVRADLVDSVKQMLALAGHRLDRLIVETSGLADPAPVLQTFLADPDLRSQVELESGITVLDALHLGAQLSDVASLEIPAAHVQPRQQWRQVEQPLRNHVPHTLLVFEFAEHLHQLRPHQHLALTLGQVAPDHYVDHAVFVFEGDEGHAAGCPRPLPPDHQPADAEAATMLFSEQVF